MGWKHTVYHIINSDPDHTSSKSSNCTNTEKELLTVRPKSRQSLGKKKNGTTAKCTFWEEVPKIKRHTFPLITTFYNFTLKIETSWARKVVKFVFETWNINEIIVYVWFVKNQKYAMQKRTILNAENFR